MKHQIKSCTAIVSHPMLTDLDLSSGFGGVCYLQYLVISACVDDIEDEEMFRLSRLLHTGAIMLMHFYHCDVRYLVGNKYPPNLRI